jgi:hypothetical protein
MMKPSWREYSNCLAASLMAKHLKKLSSKAGIVIQNWIVLSQTQTRH